MTQPPDSNRTRLRTNLLRFASGRDAAEVIADIDAATSSRIVLSTPTIFGNLPRLHGWARGHGFELRVGYGDSGRAEARTWRAVCRGTVHPEGTGSVLEADVYNPNQTLLRWFGALWAAMLMIFAFIGGLIGIATGPALPNLIVVGVSIGVASLGGLTVRQWGHRRELAEARMLTDFLERAASAGQLAGDRARA